MEAKEFVQSLPDKVNPAALEGLNTLFHFVFDDNEALSVEVNNGSIQVAEGLAGDPKCIVRAKGDDFMRVVKGDLNPMMALMTGKIKITNQSELIKYAKIFGLMG